MYPRTEEYSQVRGSIGVVDVDEWLTSPVLSIILLANILILDMEIGLGIERAIESETEYGGGMMNTMGTSSFHIQTWLNIS